MVFVGTGQKCAVESWLTFKLRYTHLRKMQAKEVVQSSAAVFEKHEAL